ncbi:hypothetical protein CKO_04885 [Citrobacter koseri ATCC BAA-895]|uniref:Uncharacterized protein n=1 Tax=Citrobacter koseri (strain ATCC BAA-895 / CDC 4225-83 / SGSC4696) TaxID=290338 RepID=A8AR16_CITK8|nr:hypothetical protein CKO_04885 [Citrobacter koseri ATCC BAA-895]
MPEKPWMRIRGFLFYRPDKAPPPSGKQANINARWRFAYQATGITLFFSPALANSSPLANTYRWVVRILGGEGEK